MRKKRSKSSTKFWATMRADEFRPPTLRSAARHQALNLLARADALTGRMAAGIAKNRVQFLYFHHLFPEEETPFRNLLLVLKRQHEFLSYSQGVEKILEGKTDGRYLVVSFDDGLKNNLRASQILSEFGIAACFFVCPSVLDEQTEQKTKEFCLNKFHSPPVPLLSWKDLERLAAQGHEIGSHTMTHARLKDLSVAEIEHEITQSFEILNRRLGNVRHFCWPYGRFSDMNPLAVRIAFQAGFRSLASAERGCHTADAPQPAQALCLRRDHVVAGWPVSHVLYFLAANARKAGPALNRWPPGWPLAVESPAEA